MPARFRRIAEERRAACPVLVDGMPVEALEGDTVLTALMLSRGFARLSEFADGERAGFCLMGACQDCWVWTGEGERLRACSTAVLPGMDIRTEVPEGFMADLRVVIVGAGPAGTRAAEALGGAGLRPVVIDEGDRSGGQIYRRQPQNFRRSYAALYGTEADKAKALHEVFDGLSDHIDYCPQTLAWAIRDNRIHIQRAETSEALNFDALIIASGATDRIMPLPGWTRPGCFSLGAAQISLKAQACAIGRRVVFMGTGPLLYLVAYQYMKAGAPPLAVLDTTPFSTQIKGLPE